jgi:hypothetical protein
MIREFEDSDIETARAIHAANDLPANCFPNLTQVSATGNEEPNPLFVVKSIYEHDGKPALISFLKVTSELYLLVDHTIGTPEERWAWLQEFKEHMKREAWRLGFEQMTAFVPREIEASFEKRLLDLGFIRSPWQSYTLNIEE